MNNEICPDFKLTPPDDNRQYVDLCCVCREPIHEGDYIYRLNGDAICEDCILDYVKQFREIAGGDE